MEYIRPLSVSKKASLLEEILVSEDIGDFKREILTMMKYLYIKRGITYHIIMYRNLDLSYKSVSPFPREFCMKTRCLKDGAWSYIDSVDDEIDIILSMEKRYAKKLSSIDDMYAIISVIDNVMRLRRGSEESDRRKTLKGRALSSIKKEHLVDICNSLSLETKHGDRIKDLAGRVERYFIANKRYILV